MWEKIKNKKCMWIWLSPYTYFTTCISDEVEKFQSPTNKRLDEDCYHGNFKNAGHHGNVFDVHVYVFMWEKMENKRKIIHLRIKKREIKEKKI